MNSFSQQLRRRYAKLRAFRLELEKRRASSDLIFFAEAFLPHLLKNKIPDFHREIYALIGVKRRLAIASPRSFAKSTITDVIYALHKLLYGKNESGIIISNSADLAVEWVRKVKNELETNEKIVEAFGRQRFDDKGLELKWQESHIILKNGNQLRGRGKGAQIRGFRPTFVVLDDLEDDELVRSKDQRDKLRDWFFGALINVLEPDQQMIYIGTLIHPLSLLKQIVDKEAEQFDAWETRKYQALVNGDSIWPDKWPAEKLRERRLEIGEHKFEAEFMNNPMADSSVVFHPNSYKWYDIIEEKIERTITGFDLIGSIKEFTGKAYVAFVTLGKGESGKVYCLDTRRGHWTQDEVAGQFVEIFKEHKPEAFVGEEISFQQIYHEYILKKVREEQKIILPIWGLHLGAYTENDPMRRAKDKVSRAISVQHVFTQGLFHLRRGGSRDFYEEISTFPGSDYTDQVDAMVHALHVLTERAKIEMTGKHELPKGLRAEVPLEDRGPKERFKKEGMIFDKRGGRFR